MSKIGVLGFSTNVNTKKIEGCKFFHLLKQQIALFDFEGALQIS